MTQGWSAGWIGSLARVRGVSSIRPWGQPALARPDWRALPGSRTDRARPCAPRPATLARHPGLPGAVDRIVRRGLQGRVPTSTRRSHPTSPPWRQALACLTDDLAPDPRCHACAGAPTSARVPVPTARIPLPTAPWRALHDPLARALFRLASARNPLAPCREQSLCPFSPQVRVIAAQRHPNFCARMRRHHRPALAEANRWPATSKKGGGRLS